MKRFTFTGILLIFIVLAFGCSDAQKDENQEYTSTYLENNETEDVITGTKDILPDTYDLKLLDMSKNGTDCKTQEHETNDRSPLAQTSRCHYNINEFNDTTISVILKKYTNFEDLNGTYQYNSMHLRSKDGLISENELGNMSRFSMNSESDYGGEKNEKGIYYYHLWIVHEPYLIHITSKGKKEAEEYVKSTGKLIVSKFN